MSHSIVAPPEGEGGWFAAARCSRVSVARGERGVATDCAQGAARDLLLGRGGGNCAAGASSEGIISIGADVHRMTEPLHASAAAEVGDPHQRLAKLLRSHTGKEQRADAYRRAHAAK
jgi:hypothetical protein